jgi:hypothetical protein
MFLVIVLVLFPIVFLFNPRLAMIALVGGIAWHFIQRTRPRTRRRPPKRGGSDEPQYQAGYEN